MNILIGSDHAGFEMKEKIMKKLAEQKINFRDFGCFSNDPFDYPDSAKKVAAAVSKNPKQNIGILICSTGVGMCITANKFKKIRAAACYTPLMAKLSREHNDANILCLGARLKIKWQPILKTFIETPFSGESRHIRRIRKINT